MAVTATPATKSESHKLRVAGWTLIGVGVVGAGLGTVFGLSAKSSTQAWGSDTTAATWQSDKSSAQSSATLANVSWIAAGVFAAAGLTFVLIDR